MSVYTTIAQQDLEHFLGNYAVGAPTTFTGISEGVENTNYFVDTSSGQRFVLTIFEHHNFVEMQYFLGLMHHLADHGVPSANPVADKAGNYLRVLMDKPAALVERLAGDSICAATLAHCAQIGSALGKLHSAGLSYAAHQPNPRGMTWCTHTASRVLCKLSAADQTILNLEIGWQRQRRDADLPRGVVHADLFRDNALWHNDTLSGIIDFYYACDDILLYDVAVTVNDWCGNANYSLDRDKTLALLAHYHQQRALQAREQSHWPTLLRAAALRFWLSRLQDWHFPRCGDKVLCKDPDAFRIILCDRIRQHDNYRYFWLA